MLRAEIITIGDEILIGQTVDSNSAFMAEELDQLGVKVDRITTVPDTREGIMGSVEEAMKRADLVLTTGGLGPTRDDITKSALSEFFGMKMIRDPQVEEDIRKWFQSKGLEVTKRNLAQADLPDGALILRNKNGSAPAMWFEKDGSVLVSMPGVPHEMRILMEEMVIPRVREMPGLPDVHRKTLMLSGLGESFIADKLTDIEDRSEQEGLELAYLPSPGIVKIRVSANSSKVAEPDRLLEETVGRIRERLSKYVFGEDADSLESVLGNKLRERGESLATAESCTGGYVAHSITSVPGSSDYFKGSIVSYCNEVKERLLGVSSDALDKHGAVSQEVVEQMARGGKEELRTDWAVATSGIMGPGGGSSEKPVGTVWIGVAGPGVLKSKKVVLGKERDINIVRASRVAIDLVRREIKKKE